MERGGRSGREREWGGARAVVRREVSGEGGGAGEGEGGAFWGLSYSYSLTIV